jgi:hypothetical protein
MLKKIIKNWLMAILWPKPLIGIFYIPKLFVHWLRFSRIDGAPKIKFSDLQPCLGDWTSYTPFDAHYFYQGAWLARKVVNSKSIDHVDIASSALTISVLSANVDTTFVDYRPLKANLSGLKSVAGNILDLSFKNGSVASLSCLHVIEHIGLGRYGDPLDPEGSVKAARELERIVSEGGSLYLSTPVGRERICFNAHRVFSPLTIVSLFPNLELVDFSFVDDVGEFHQNIELSYAEKLDYGCGMFHFTKSAEKNK